MSSFTDLSERGKRLVLVAFTVLACVALLLAAEAAVRLRAYLKHGYSGGVEATFVLDERTGLRIPRPGAELGPIRHNAQGFRGPAIEMPKPPGRLRLAFLGGSTTYCAEVSSNEKTWPQVVTRRLADAMSGIEVDHVNAGVPGYAVSMSLANLRARVAALGPDVVVIYHATNDLAYNTFQLARAAGLIEKRPDAERFWLARYSLLVDLLEKNLRVASLQTQASAPAGKLALDAGRAAAPFREDLRALVREAKLHAPVVALVTFASRLRRGQSDEALAAAAVSSLYYMPYLAPRDVLAGYERYNDVIREVAHEEGTLLVEGADAVPADGAHFTDSVHLTDAGAERLAHRIAAALAAAPALGARVTPRAP